MRLAEEALCVMSSTGVQERCMKRARRGEEFELQEKMTVKCTLNMNSGELEIRSGQNVAVLPVEYLEQPSRYFACAFLSPGCSVAIKGQL
jgi:hypothetical protein